MAAATDGAALAGEIAAFFCPAAAAPAPANLGRSSPQMS